MGLPKSWLSAGKNIQEMLGVPAGKGLSVFGSWDGSRRMLLAQGRADPPPEHQEKAEESPRRLQAPALEESFWGRWIFPKEKPPRPPGMQERLWVWQAQAGECFKARGCFLPALILAFGGWEGFK